MTRHHLDHASTVPMRPAARRAMRDLLDTDLGDPSRLYHDALTARAVLEDARDRVAATFGARPREVVFTSGATESVVTAAWGGAQRGDHQAYSAVEHSAVRLAVERHHPGTSTVGVDRTGRVEAAELLAAAGDSCGMVHCQWVNHEVGTVQPVAEVVAACRERGVWVHVDAAQAAGRVPLDFAELGADFVSISGHKLGAPTGIGALLVRRGVRIDPLFVGGDQERARRAGVEPVLAAAALAATVEDIDVDAEADRARTQISTIAASLTEVDGVELYGPEVDAGEEYRAPHLVAAGVVDIEPQALLFGLDRAGINTHSGSACASEGLEPSPVLDAMGVDAHHSLRLSVGWNTTDDDVDAFARAFPRVVEGLRSLRPR